MKQEHHPKSIRLNNQGANTSDEKIYVGAGDNGSYLDSNNMRRKSYDGNDMDLEKIRGEEVIPSLVTPVNPEDYFCIGSTSVKYRRVEVWVDTTAAAPPFIRIDGTIVCQSVDLPFTKDYPLQIDVNEGCGEEGEIFLTDHNTTPLIFDIKDLLDNVATPKYFAGFNYDIYTVNLNKPLDIPVFVQLENVGGSGGLPVGVYEYGIAYVTKSGDRTAISEKTPPIPIVRALSEGTRVFPWVRTYGDTPNSQSNTSFAPRIRFRVTNDLNFDSIEIIRFDYNTGEGINFTPTARVVGRIDISDGEIGIVDFIDPTDSDRNIQLSVEEETQQSYLIETAKGIRYYGNRLVMANIKVVEKVDTSNFKSINDNKIFPVLEKLGTSGHNNPWHHSYRSSYMGGEKETFAVHFWDAVGGKTFVKEDDDLKNIQYPNRRDVMSSDSQDYSYQGFPTMADVDGNVSAVFESFDHVNAVSKGDYDNFKNILKKGSRLETTVDENSATDHEDYQAADGITALTVKAPWLNWRPGNQTDQGDSHDMLPNVEVDSDGFFGAGNKFDYDPDCFSPEYYAKGYALAGLENIPAWAKSFSVVRTEPAGRVVCQGLGMYKILPGSYRGNSSDKITKKHKSQMWFFSPDIDSGIISQAEIDNIRQNPGDYKVQFVSPLGFFSEAYSFESNAFKDHLVDMMSYARVQRDNGEINPGSGPTSGPGGYVYYNKYRGVDSPLFDVNGGWFSGSNGNKEMGINLFDEIREGRGSYFVIGFDEDIYGVRNVGGTAKRDFDDDGLKNWTEPFYMINIIKTGAEAPNEDIQGFKSTATHVKLESIIGLGDGVDLIQEFPLVDERWEDCCRVGNPQPTDLYLYLRNVDDNTERIFYDVSDSTAPQIAAIIADIIANGFWISPSGFQVVGIYTHENLGSGVKKNHEFVIKFDQAGYYPEANEYIVVKYDNRIPIRFFGGDTFVGETIFAPIDRELKLTDNSDDPEDTEQFVLNAGWPYGRLKMNPRYFRTKNTTAVNKIQDDDWFSFSHLRQMCMMFNCDTRIAAHFAFEEDYPKQFYPLTHYVMRPNVWDDTLTLRENNIFDEYEVEYPGEFPDRFRYGGLRFLQNYNADYSSRGRIEFFSRPDIGFDEKYEFCNRVIWSLPRATNQQDSPGLKTFLVGNTFDIEDGQGEIKFLYAATYSDKGSNIYAVTERGVCLLLTNKSILSNVDANFLTSVSSDQFIAQEFWVDREIGCSGQFWRGKAEGTAGVPSDMGDSELEFCVWPNRDSVFILIGNQVKDVGENKYINTLTPYLSAHPLDTSEHMTGIFDENHDEYWLEVQVGEDRQNFKLSLEDFRWTGRQDYRFDKYVFVDGEMYGMKGYFTYTLNKGFLIDGNPIECWMKQVFSKEPYSDKEFIRIGAETGGRSGVKPTKIEFLDQNDNIIAEMSEALYGPDWLLRYDHWEQFIPRQPGVGQNDGDRIQDQLLIYKIIHNLAGDFKIVNTSVQYKVLK